MSNPIEPTDVDCPYCGSTHTVWVDLSAGSQETIEDCASCCQPIRLLIELDPASGELLSLSAFRGDE